MSNSINTNIAAFYAQENITTASNAATENVAQLSSGNAIINASDNVAALAVGTSIGTQVSILNAAQTNAAQGTSLLQVADGALAQIQSILQQQQSIANQAQSGSLTDTDRGFLNEEFQTLTNEINALASGTTFNGVSLINGAISGGANINTNVTNGSASLPVSATLATLGTNVSSGNTLTITVAGQSAETFTFGTASGDVGIGATAVDSTANLASALNNSGLSQLSNFRFVASGTTLSAYYTGDASSISNIPALTIAADGDAITPTASPSFSANTDIGSISGTVAAGDTFTIGSHTVTFEPEGTTYTGTSNPYATTTLGNGEVNIGLTTDTNGVTGTALTNLADFLNSVAGTSGWTDLSGITFSPNSTGTELYASYSGGGATQPTLSTSYTSNSANAFSGGSDNTIQQSTSIFNTSTNLSAGSTINLGGTSITFVSGTAGAGQVTIGGNATVTLNNLVTFLNTSTNSAYIGTQFKSGGTVTAIFSDDSSGNLYANNGGITTTTGSTPYTATTTFTNTLLTATQATAYGATNSVSTGDTNGSSAYEGSASTGTAILTSTSTHLAVGDTVTVGSAVFTIGSGGTTSGLYINTAGAETNASDDLVYAAIAAYLNTTDGQTAANLSTSQDALVFSDDSTTHTLMMYNAGDSTAAITGPAVSTTGSSTANSAASVSAQNGAVLTVTNAGAGNLAAGTNAIQYGTSITIGVNNAAGSTIIFGTAAQVTAGTAQVTVGATDADSLQNLRDYLNSSAGQAKLGGAMDGLYFTTDGTSLYVGNSSGAQLTSAAHTAPVAALNVANINPTTTTIVTGLQLGVASVAGSFTGTSAISSGSTLTVGTNATLATNFNEDTVFSIGGTNVSFGTALEVADGTKDVEIGDNNADTLANLATYLNTSSVNSNLGDSYKNLTFSASGDDLVATNDTDAIITPTATSSFTDGPTGAALWAHAAIAEGGSVNVISPTSAGALIGTQFSGATTLDLGANTISFGTAAQVTAKTADVTIGANNLETLNNLVSYLNGSTVNEGLGDYAGLHFSTNGTTLTATNEGSGNVTLSGSDDVSFGANTAPTNAQGWTAADIDVGKNATLLTMGVSTLVFGSSAEVSSGAANVDAGSTLADSLNAAVTYLNANVPYGSNTVYSTNGTNLLAQNSDGTNTPTLTAIFSSTDPIFTGVTGKLITATGVVGLGAGTTSAVGAPSGSLLVSSTGTTDIDYGNGVDLSGVANNADFVGAFGGAGTIGDITANYVNTGVTSTSGVQFSVVVGNDTYTTGTITNTELASTTAPVTVTFTGSNSSTSAAEGGSFTLTLQPQAEVTSQNGADQLATGLNAALSGVDAYQNRNVLSYNNNYSAEVNGTQTASLAGSSLSFNSNDFSNPLVTSVSVSSPSTGSTDAKITAVINGDTYTTTSGIGDDFSANDEIVLENGANPDQTVTLTLGTSGFANLSNSSDAAAFQTALSSALGIGAANGGLTFQLGATSAANVNVTIANATTSSLFNGASLDVSTATDAATAATAITNALNTVTAIRSNVGALETQFNFAAAALQSGVQNESAAQSQLLDTNIATVSTAYATNQVKIQAGISVLAQANQQTQALLKLIG